MLFIGGVLPVLYMAARAALRPRPAVAPVAPSGDTIESPLFREVMPGSEPPSPAGVTP